MNFDFSQLNPAQILEQVRPLLSQLSFPITKENLVKAVRERGANDMVVGAIEKLPDKLFESQQDILQNLQQRLGGLGNLGGLGGFKL